MKNKVKNVEEKSVKEKHEFVDVPVQVLGEVKQKKYVSLEEVKFNSEWGNLFTHLDDKHTLLIKKGFQEKHLKVGLKPASEIETSVRKSPKFKDKESIDSTVRMKVIGKRNGRIFVGPTGSVKYDPVYKGLQIHLDDKHVSIIDGETLSRNLGLKLIPLALERNTPALSR